MVVAYVMCAKWDSVLFDDERKSRAGGWWGLGARGEVGAWRWGGGVSLRAVKRIRLSRVGRGW